MTGTRVRLGGAGQVIEFMSTGAVGHHIPATPNRLVCIYRITHFTIFTSGSLRVYLFFTLLADGVRFYDGKGQVDGRADAVGHNAAAFSHGDELF